MLRLVCDPFLYIGITFATLKLLGTIPVSKERLNKISEGLTITLFNVCNAFIGILKGPEALPGFNFEISSSISHSLIGERKKLSHGCSFICMYSSGDFCTTGIVLARFFPTFAKYTFNTLAISVGSTKFLSSLIILSFD